MEKQLERESTFCSSCGYPAYAGHSFQCAKRNTDKSTEQKLERQGWGTSEIGVRSLDDYIKFTGLSVEELQGKKVLDIGSSITQRFADEAAKKKITAVSLSPDLSREEYRKILKRHKNNRGKINQLLRRIRGCDWKGLAVGAIAEHMPFKDNSFDAEVGL